MQVCVITAKNIHVGYKNTRTQTDGQAKQADVGKYTFTRALITQGLAYSCFVSAEYIHEI